MSAKHQPTAEEKPLEDQPEANPLEDQPSDNEAALDSDELPPGTQLSNGTYTIVRHLKSGGFGITYLAHDTLERPIVIKECFPNSVSQRVSRAVRQRSRSGVSGLADLIGRFVSEAHSLARINHPNVVKVHQVFKENDTAYMAMDFVNGQDLVETMADPATRLNPDEIRTTLLKLLDAVDTIHSVGLLHRDISPDNILMGAGRNPVIIDFGAAREQERTKDNVATKLNVVKDGYSPHELYLSGTNDLGPWSDLYALAATFYHAISGEAPPNSQTRLASMASNTPDPCVPLAGRITGYDPAVLKTIDRAMSVLPKNRLQSAKDWIAALTKAPAQTATAPTGTSPSRLVTPMTRVTRFEAEAARKSAGPLMYVGALAAVAVVATGVYLAMPKGGTPGAANTPNAVATAASPRGGTSSAAPANPAVAAATSAIATPAPAAAAPVAEAPAAVADAPSGRSDVSPLTSNWTVSLPFAAAQGQPNVVGTISGPVPEWLVPGLQITAVNGTPIASLDEITGLLRSGDDPGEAPFVGAILSTNGPAGALDQPMEFPVFHRIVLASGAEFQVSWTGSAWQTKVLALPDTYNGEMRIDDVVLGHVSTNTRLDNPTALKTSLESDIIAGLSSTKLAVQQGGQMWVVTFPLPR